MQSQWHGAVAVVHKAEQVFAAKASDYCDGRADYVARGRPFKDMPDALLVACWVRAFEHCAFDRGKPEEVDLTDLGSEIELREIEVDPRLIGRPA